MVCSRSTLHYLARLLVCKRTYFPATYQQTAVPAAERVCIRFLFAENEINTLVFIREEESGVEILVGAVFNSFKASKRDSYRGKSKSL
jgi:hypothetical protein